MPAEPLPKSDIANDSPNTDIAFVSLETAEEGVGVCFVLLLAGEAVAGLWPNQPRKPGSCCTSLPAFSRAAFSAAA
jgi:hypothetical protein